MAACQSWLLGRPWADLGQLEHPPQKERADPPAVTSTGPITPNMQPAGRHHTCQELPPPASTKCCFLGV